MTDPIQVEAYALASMAAVATMHAWTMSTLTDGSINFDPPSENSAPCDHRKVRCRLFIAKALGPVDFLGDADSTTGGATLDAAAHQVASLFDSDDELARYLVAEGEAVRRILAQRASQIDELAHLLISRTKTLRN